MPKIVTKETREQIKSLYKTKGYTQEVIAAKFNVSYGFVNSVINDRPMHPKRPDRRKSYCPITGFEFYN